jgi:N-methylhydantoinase B
MGGDDGARGIVRLMSGNAIRAAGRQKVMPEDSLIVETPGGGGFGNPRERAPECVARDVHLGYVTRDEARARYGVVLDAEGNFILAATQELRRRLASRNAGDETQLERPTTISG